MRFFSFFTLALSLFSQSPLVAGGKHVHDEAELSIAVDGTKATVDFEAPAHPIYGFEREPKDAKEMSRREAAIAKLTNEFTTMVTFDASLQCVIKTHKVDPFAAEEGGHGEVVATFHFECKKPLKGKGAFVKFAHAFPELKKTEITIVSDKQSSAVAGKNGIRVTF